MKKYKRYLRLFLNQRLILASVCLITVAFSYRAHAQQSQVAKAYITNFHISGFPTATAFYTLGTKTYAYFANDNQDPITLCTVNNVGQLEGCKFTGPALRRSEGIAIHTSGGIPYAYITIPSEGKILRCEITKNAETTNNSGNLINCNPTTLAGHTLSSPYGIAISTIGSQTYAYITNSNARSNTVSKCLIDERGDFTNCDTVGRNFSIPYGISIQNVMGKNYAYIVNREDKTISKCDIQDSDGTFSSCHIQSTVPKLSNRLNIKVYTTNEGVTYAYISGAAGSKIEICAVNNQDGSLIHCDKTGSGFNGAQGIEINTIGEHTYAYVPNYNDSSVTQCTVEKNGQFTCHASGFSGEVVSCAINGNDGTLYDCTPTVGGLTRPYGITTDSIDGNSYAYITNATTTSTVNSVSKCKIKADGNLERNCNTTGSGFRYPSAISILREQNTAYILNKQNNTVSSCKIEHDGNFKDCTSAIKNTLAPNEGIAAATINGISYVYITNSLDKTVSQCMVSAEHVSLTPCTLSQKIFNFPYGITIHNTQTNIFAYIVNHETNNVSQCRIEPNHGTLLDCRTTGNGFNRPTKIGIITLHGKTFAYVMNKATDINQPSSVSVCTVDDKGGLENCNLTGNGMSIPLDIAFKD